MSRKAPQLDDCEHVLIVEGYTDQLFLSAFLHHINRAEGVYIKECKGKDRLLKADLLSDFLNPKVLAEKKSIGILVDADQDARAAAQAVHDCLQKVVGRNTIEGTWHEQPDGPRVGFFILPNGSGPGTIETLVWNALPAEGRHGAMKRAVDGFHHTMADLGWKAGSPDKARIGAFLSAAYAEDPRLGPGAREGLFDLDSPGFARLRRFLEVLPTSWI